MWYAARRNRILKQYTLPVKQRINTSFAMSELLVINGTVDTVASLGEGESDGVGANRPGDTIQGVRSSVFFQEKIG